MPDVWLLNVLSCAFIIAMGWLVITKIFPMLEDLLSTVIKDKKGLNSFMGLLNILILWMVAQGIVIYLLKINYEYLNYLDAVSSGLDVVLEFMPYFKWIILGWFILLAFQSHRR
jgi:hypothetical protein